MEICFVTSNIKKFKEAEKILGMRLRKVDVDVMEVQSMDASEVVRHKAREAYKIVRKPLFVEDTGLYINAFNGFPGALIKWMLKTVGNEGICRMLDPFNERGAYAKTSVCFFDGSKERVFEGVVKGRISDRPRGRKDFGWDPIFIPEGSSKTFAEMSKEEKNEISMRARALRRMSLFLNEVKN